MSGKTVSELNITVIKIDIVRAGTGEVVNCPITEEKEMNILDISKSNPVVLSDVSVPSGDYEQLRLVIKNNATITVDDETFDIKIPSGEQSGVKLDGNFSIRGKFFRLDLDFIPEESVIYNKGQGYIMKPVIKISDTAELLGYYRGNLDFGSGIGISECVLELNQDNTFKAKMANYPDRIIFGKYEYSSWYKTLKLWDFETEIEIKKYFTGETIFTKRISLKEYNESVPENIPFTINQWNPEEVIGINLNGIENRLVKVNNFDFSENVKYTNFNIIVKYPDDSKNGKKVAVEIKFLENSSIPWFQIFLKIHQNGVNIAISTILTKYKNDDFVKKYYIPMQNSTMAGIGYVTNNTQYGAVNSYILMGEFLRRIRVLPINTYYIAYMRDEKYIKGEYNNFSVYQFINGIDGTWYNGVNPDEY